MTRWNYRLRNLLIAGGLASICSTSCSKMSVPGSDGSSTAAAPVEAKPGEPVANKDATLARPAAADFDQSFDAAVITEVLEGQHLPPDQTFSGKKTGPLRVAVEALWPKIKLTDQSNRPLPQVVQFETSEGSFEVALNPELAPNHVRNLLVLAQLGFYDGLVFERNIKQEIEENGVKTRLDLLIGGCPIGTGDDGYGHLGYFMRPEFQPYITHTAGTVGFWHEEDPNSAGCRLYVTLGPALALDGKFTVVGQVARGLDTLQRIAAQPVKNSQPTSPDNEKPIHPTVIKKVSVLSVSQDR